MILQLEANNAKYQPTILLSVPVHSLTVLSFKKACLNRKSHTYVSTLHTSFDSGSSQLSLTYDEADEREVSGLAVFRQP
jgi:hypothetical protein